jgi:hypothetical protein
VLSGSHPRIKCYEKARFNADFSALNLKCESPYGSTTLFSNDMTAIDFVNTLRKPWKWTPLFYASYLIAILAATVGWVSLLAWIAMELFDR